MEYPNMNTPSPRRVTLKDIAQACGYSANTVSRALRDDKKLPESTRQTIQHLAQAMGYVPNSSARTLRSGSSRTVAVIVNDINNPYYANILNQIDQLLQEKDYRTMILCTQLSEDLASAMIQLAVSHMVDGILFFPFNNIRHIHELQASGIPFVLMDRRIPGIEADIARIDDFAAGYMQANHLLDLGHRKFLYMAGPFVNSSQVDRQNGIIKALQDAGLDPDQHMRTLAWNAIPAEPTPASIFELLKPLDYTGILAFNDVLAYHALTALYTAGYHVPSDFSVIGIDHIRWCNTYLPPLTSIATVNGQNVARTAIEMLFRRIEDPEAPYRHRVIPVRLHEDGTTGPVHHENI